MSVDTPDWVKDAIFYQIFPDRFARSEQHRQLPGVTFKPWGSPPAEQGYQGGDLYGVMEKLDYLQNLGINAIYLNPIFSSASNHRYHTFDYMEVDPLLGDKQALRDLLDAAHERGIRIILDGVFNHASRGFWAFHHILENGSASPYVDWFHIDDWPLNPYPQGEGEELNYQSWWGMPALPKFNTDNPGVRAFLFEVAEYWTEFGIDGWRLDVPQEIDDDEFWREFRSRVRAINPEAYIVGEIWHRADRWLQGDQFDAVMNYPIGTAALSFFGHNCLKEDIENPELNYEPIAADTMAARVGDILSWYDWDITCSQLNLLDSHDMPRALWLLQGNRDAFLQSLGFLLTMPGAPCIYYGDEVGMSGGDDPECRGAFPWHEPEQMDQALRDQVRQLCKARHELPILRHGEVTFRTHGEHVLVAERTLNQARAWVVYHRGEDAIDRSALAPVVPENATLQRQLLGASSDEQVVGYSITLYQ